MIFPFKSVCLCFFHLNGRVTLHSKLIFDTIIDIGSIESFCASDWSQVAVVGHSAGGQLAVWSTAQLGARTRNCTISTVVAQSAALNLEAAARGGSESVQALIGRPYEDAPHLYREASPSAQEPFGAHVVAIHTADDEAIPLIVSRRYVELMTERGQSAELVVVPGEGHSAFCDPRSRANRETARVLGI